MWYIFCVKIFYFLESVYICITQSNKSKTKFNAMQGINLPSLHKELSMAEKMQQLKREFLQKLLLKMYELKKVYSVEFSVEIQMREIINNDEMNFNGCGIIYQVEGNPNQYWAIALTRNAKQCYLLCSKEPIDLTQGPTDGGWDKWHSFRYDQRTMETFSCVMSAFRHSLRFSIVA